MSQKIEQWHRKGKRKSCLSSSFSLAFVARVALSHFIQGTPSRCPYFFMEVL